MYGTTVDNHKCVVVLCNGSIIVNKIQQKTDRRCTAETLSLSTLCYLMTVAATHLVIGDRDETVNPHAIGDTLPRAMLLHNLVRDLMTKLQSDTFLLHYNIAQTIQQFLYSKEQLERCKVG